ncbi:MAG: ribbon-helix-helix domain-containing protein [Bifidobacteriaceae bacterium]|jgi:hypothetical protein|nr:ribbon-helix-helix domain-containing protein [Bifidobacteriaceae bacterium]
MALPTSLRIPPDLDSALESCARRKQTTKSSLIVDATREWLAVQAHPLVHFVSTVTGDRRAALLSGPQVWTVAEAWEQHDDAERNPAVVADATGLSEADVLAALAYWADHRAEIDGILERHRLEQDEELAAWERRRALINGQ